MHRYVCTILLVVGVSTSLFAASQQLGGPQAPPVKASIEGTVVRPTGEPLSRAQVTIVRNAPPAPQAGQPAPNPQGGTPQTNAAAASATAVASIAPVFTDDQGKFLIKDLEPGTYRLFAARNGFTRMEYGQKLMNRPGTVLNLTSGQSLKDVTFRLTPAGTVTGRIVDDQGEPLPGLTVQVLRSTYDANGKRTLSPTASAKTNDLGEYRVYFVPPGRYYVSAGAATSGLEALAATAAQAGLGGTNLNEVIAPGYVLTYYPNTPDYTRAAAIEIQPGAEISSIHFTMARQQRFHVKGHVVDFATGKPPQTANITLSARNSAVAQNPLDAILGAASGANNYNSADGSFDLRDVAPGSYWLQTVGQGQNPSGGTPTPAGAAAAAIASLSIALTPVDVSGSDVENLSIIVGNGVTIPGRVQVEGSLPNGFTLDRVGFALIPSNGVVTLATVLQQARASADGSFSLEKVNAGEYRLAAVAQGAPAIYLKSARFGETDILASGFTVMDRSPGPLAVTLSTNGGQIDGTVMDKDSKPVRGIQAVLIPDRNRERRDVYKTANTDQNGHFTMLGVTPGEYKLFAWEDIEPFSYNDPEVLKQFEEKGKPIRVVESAKDMVELRLIPAVTP